MRPDVDLVVQRERLWWTVRPWFAKATGPGVQSMLENVAPPFLLGKYRSKATASAVAVAVAKVLALSAPDGSTEVFWRNSRNGRIVERNTYGRDPEASKG